MFGGFEKFWFLFPGYRFIFFFSCSDVIDFSELLCGQTKDVVFCFSRFCPFLGDFLFGLDVDRLAANRLGNLHIFARKMINCLAAFARPHLTFQIVIILFDVMCVDI